MRLHLSTSNLLTHQPPSLSRRMALLMPILALGVTACGSSKPQAPAVAIEISHIVGGQPLALGETSYVDSSGETFSVSKLRYYLSNFRLQQADGHWFEPTRNADSPDGYYLVDEAKPETKRFKLPVAPAGEYRAIEFVLGVDAARNHAGAQRGALDPALGMFWTWNTGYIFLKLEGHSPVSPAPDKGYEYHLGSDPLAHTIVLPLAPKPVQVEAAIQPTIHLAADIGVIFGGGTEPLSIAKTFDVMDPKGGAPIADAAATMFKVDHIHHEPAAATR